MKIIQKIIFLSFIIGFPVVCHSNINVFACQPEWGWLADKIGGEHVTTYNATNGEQNQHQINIFPEMLKQLRGARVIICTGAGIEQRWFPVITKKLDNPLIVKGQPGHIIISDFVGKTIKQDKFHPKGNPHFHLDPAVVLQVAGVIAQRFSKINPSNRRFYRKKLTKFKREWGALMTEVKSAGALLSGMNVIQYHPSWTYFLNWLGMKSVGTILPDKNHHATTRSLGKLAAKLKKQPATMVIYAKDYKENRVIKWFSKKIKQPDCELLLSLNEEKKLLGLGDLYRHNVKLMVDIVRIEQAKELKKKALEKKRLEKERAEKELLGLKKLEELKKLKKPKKNKK